MQYNLAKMPLVLSLGCDLRGRNEAIRLSLYKLYNRFGVVLNDNRLLSGGVSAFSQVIFQIFKSLHTQNNQSVDMRL